MNLQPPSGGSCLSPLHFTCSHTDIKGSSNTFQVSVITSPTCIPVCNPETTHTHTHFPTQQRPKSRKPFWAIYNLACQAAVPLPHPNDLTQKGFWAFLCNMCAQLKLCSHKGHRFVLLFILTFIYLLFLPLLFSLFDPSDQGVMDRQAHRCVEGTRMRCCAQWSTLRRGQCWLLGGVGAECGDGKQPSLEVQR